eukprot:4572460-Amphidinium_carterae.1
MLLSSAVPARLSQASPSFSAPLPAIHCNAHTCTLSLVLTHTRGGRASNDHGIYLFTFHQNSKSQLPTQASRERAEVCHIYGCYYSTSNGKYKRQKEPREHALRKHESQQKN